MWVLGLMLAAVAQDDAQGDWQRAQDLERYAIRYEMQMAIEMPDQRVALLESAYVGFGAGHFYAQRSDMGAAMLTTQALGLSMVGGSLAWRSDQPGRWTENGGPEAMIGGFVLYGVARVLDVALAPGSAKRTQRAILARQF